MKKTPDHWRMLLRTVTAAALLACLCLLIVRTSGQLRYNDDLREAEIRAEQLRVEMEQQQRQQAAEAASPESEPVPTATPVPSPEPSFAPSAVPEADASLFFSASYVKVGEEEPYQIALSAADSEAAVSAGEESAAGETGTDTTAETGEEESAELPSFTLYETERIFFDYGDKYSDAIGIVTFRGNNFRDGGSYGTTEVTNETITEIYTLSTSSMYDSSGAIWGGSAWTGQPLVMQWPQSVRATMNMYDWAKEQAELTEVILACLDGNVYCFELETGKQTRDPIKLGYSFKGAGSLDPRGYPLLYVGGGLTTGGYSQPRIMVVSLLTGEILYTVGNNDDFAPRDWTAFDSSPLVDAETDTLIYPGENGVLYLIKLNTAYNETDGTIAVDPTVVRWTYTAEACEESTYYGVESSLVAWCGHAFMADNSGNFFCLNLNTLSVDWCVDVLDDTNCTPVLEVEDGHAYLYISTSFHYGWRSYYSADIPVWKIDAETGEILWRRDYTCYTESGVSGGTQGSLAIGKGQLEGLVYAAIGRTPNGSDGTLVAFDKNTGEEVWTYVTPSYSWSSPVCFYDSAGRGYILLATHGGSLWVLDGLTGELICDFDTAQTLEATPIVWNGYVVIASRWNTIWGFKIS